VIGNVAELEKKLKMIPGVVETGLFVNLADTAYVGTASAVEKIERKRK
jgi:ribose 5-phosphate isomerase A